LTRSKPLNELHFTDHSRHNRKAVSQVSEATTTNSKRFTVLTVVVTFILQTPESDDDSMGDPRVPSTPEDLPKSIRSKLLEFDDWPHIKDYKYTKLPEDKKQIRLMRLLPGVLENPQIDCEMFIGEFDQQGDLIEVVGQQHNISHCLMTDYPLESPV
jgi:hypothetical protein